MLGGRSVFPGERAFYLYDSLGFPIDLTQLMAQEQGLIVDINEFQQAMNTQKERGRLATKAKRLSGLEALTLGTFVLQFCICNIQSILLLGAEQTSYLQKSGVVPTNDELKYSLDVTLTAQIQAIYTKTGFKDTLDKNELASLSGQVIGIILDKTSVYCESGGQVADSGNIVFHDSETTSLSLDIIDVQVYGGYVLHLCVVSDTSELEKLSNCIAKGLLLNKPIYLIFL